MGRNFTSAANFWASDAKFWASDAKIWASDATFGICRGFDSTSRQIESSDLDFGS